MAPFSTRTRAAFAAWADEVGGNRRLILAAFLDGGIIGTVQVIHALPPNQPHRADTRNSSSTARRADAASRNC